MEYNSCTGESAAEYNSCTGESSAVEGGAVVAELEGGLLKDPDPFPYFMLMAFEASGLIRFALLLLSWPLIFLVTYLGAEGISLRIMVFIAMAGVKYSEIEAVSRAVLPKFYGDDVDHDAWKVFNCYRGSGRRCRRLVVTTRCPKVMVEKFARDHLGADEVVGAELVVNRFGYATGSLNINFGPGSDQIRALFNDEMPEIGLTGRPAGGEPFLISLCKEKLYRPFTAAAERASAAGDHRPAPVIFHDGRLVCRPTPSTSLIILLWFPFGVLLAAVRIILGIVVPMRYIPALIRPLGGELKVHGFPPPPSNGGVADTGGVLFVCTHRTLMDPVVLAVVLQRRVPAVTYSISRLSEILSPIPTVRLTRDRHVDGQRIKNELSKGDLVVCPEGTTCREPFLLRFSALFAELTDRIVPVAINYRVGFFHPTTARGWKGLDPIFFMMNPRPVYEVTFLRQLPREATCTAGKSPHDVANHVQRLLAAALGFECTSFTRKDKYRVLAGNDGTVGSKAGLPWADRAGQVIRLLLHRQL